MREEVRPETHALPPSEERLNREERERIRPRFLCSVSAVPWLCANREPGLDWVGGPRPEMTPGVLEQHEGEQGKVMS